MRMFDFITRSVKYILKGIPVTQVNISTNITGKILNRKHILITGGSKGIGFAIAKRCVQEGAQVLICSRNIRDLKEAQESLGGEDNCKIIEFDLSNTNEIGKFLNLSYSLLDNRIDCLVNNAGISFHEKNYKFVTIEGFDKQFAVNFKGSYFLAQQFLMEQERRNLLPLTNIVFVSSERGSFCTDIPYGLSKAVINSLVGGLNNRTAIYGTRVNAIAPGVTVSEMTGRNKEDLQYKGSPIGRVLLPEEIAEVAIFLLSDYSSCISGEVINCDSGAHLKCY